MNIYIYGDSNTWGYIPSPIPYSGNDEIQPRYEMKDIWWYQLTKNNKVIADGNNGRTTAYDHLSFPNKNASKTIKQDLEKVNEKIDILIIMLGSNDLKTRYYATIQDITKYENELIKIIKAKFNCKVLVMCPPYIKIPKDAVNPVYEDGERKIDLLYESLKELCINNDYYFGDLRNCDLGIDGLHLSINGHKQAGEIVSKLIKNIK